MLADSHFSQAGMQIMPMWMLVDSQLLICFATRDTRMNLSSNEGERTTEMVGNLPGYETVWYDADSIAKI